MKERPILFSGEMVRALLAGRKIQTRRGVKRMDSGCVKETGGHRNWHLDDPNVIKACPYGQPGDRLWVREAWCHECDDGYIVYNHHGDFNTSCFHYKADGEDVVKMDGDGSVEYTKSGYEASPWKPSIHMPRWAARITLEITGVRVERLNEISGADAIAEGIEPHSWEGITTFKDYITGKTDRAAYQSYRTLWDSINAKKVPWASNPWVWVIGFKVL